MSNPGETHNINSFLKAWKETKSVGSYLASSTSYTHLEWRVSQLAKHASLASQGAFTEDQCTEVIWEWAEYHEAFEKLAAAKKLEEQHK